MDPLTAAAVLLMGVAIGAVLYQEDIQVPATPITVLTTTETLAASSLQVTTPNPNGKAAVRAWCDFTVGAGTTAITLTLYLGNAIGGTVVGTRTPEAGDFTPGSTAHFEIEAVYMFSNVGDVQFVMSIQQTGATGNGTVQAALIDTKVLSG